MSKDFYLVVTSFTNNRFYFTYDKTDIEKKTPYDFTIKLKLINENELELLSTIKYTDNMPKSYRIIIELLKKSYGLFEKHHKITLDKPINLNKDILKQLEKSNVSAYTIDNKTIPFDSLLAVFKKLLGK